MKGLKYPFTFQNGAPESAEGDELVASAVNQLFAQEKGERPRDEENGINITKYTFENNNHLLRANIRREVMLAFSRNEPRARLVSASARAYVGDEGVALEIEPVWRYRSKYYALTRLINTQR